MANESGQPSTPLALLTREVRWFSAGSLPAPIFEWFSGGTAFKTEHRHDLYDLASARNGVGRKHRNATALDTKYRVEVFENVNLAPRMSGHLEDWMKVSHPLREAGQRTMNAPFAVEKLLHTRRYDLGDQESGCEAELAEITTGSVQAWSLCFETYGQEDRRHEALREGIARFIVETPLPNSVEFSQRCCLAYPDWISGMGSSKGC